MDLTFSQGIIGRVDAAGMLILLAIFAIGFIIIKRYATNVLPGFIGILAYFLVGYFGSQAVMILLVIIPFTRILTENVWGYCILNAISVAFMYQLARWINMMLTDRAKDYELGGYLMGGLGIGAGQAIMSGMNLLYIGTLGRTINSEEGANAFVSMSAQDLQNIVEAVEKYNGIPMNDYFLMGLNCALYIGFQVLMGALIYGIIKKGMPKVWNVYMILLGFVMEFIYGIGTFGAFEGLQAEGGMLQGLGSSLRNSLHMDLYVLSTMGMLVVLIAVFLIVRQADQNYLSGEFSSFDKMKTSTTKKMPRMKK